MRAVYMYEPGDVRVIDAPDPRIEEPTDALLRLVRTCVCGSDLHPYHSMKPRAQGVSMGHEYLGIVEEVGADVRSFRTGDFVIVPFDHCDNTCPHCLAGAQNGCVNLGFTQSGQAELTRVTQAEGSLVKTDGVPDAALLPSILTLSDVMPTGWHAAVSAGVREGGTAVVVGDGAVGLCGVLAARVLGAEKIIAMSRHEPRQAIARSFGATHIVAERGEEGLAAILEITGGVGADAVLECVGTNQSMTTAFDIARPGATVGFVGVPHGVELPVRRMFQKNIGLAGGMAPTRRYIPELLALVLDGTIEPGLVFDSTLPLDQVAEGYRAMDERRAVKVLIEP